MANLLKNDLASLAIDHCIFPIVDAADVRRDGPAVIESGAGLTVTDAAGKPHLDMISAYTRAIPWGTATRRSPRRCTTSRSGCIMPARSPS